MQECLLNGIEFRPSTAWLASSSWLQSGNSAMEMFLKEKSAGAGLTMASARLRLSESRLKLPTMTAIWY
jgi:hypothetical protein